MPSWGRRTEPRWVQAAGQVIAHTMALVGFAIVAMLGTMVTLTITLSIAAGVARQWDTGPADDVRLASGPPAQQMSGP